MKWGKFKELLFISDDLKEYWMFSSMSSWSKVSGPASEMVDLESFFVSWIGLVMDSELASLTGLIRTSWGIR